jgi:hypothetical protein
MFMTAIFMAMYWPLWVEAGTPAVLARCCWGLASCSSWSLQPVHWGAVAVADMLGRAALTAHLTWYLGVVAPQDMVMTMMMRGPFTRAQLLMMNVHDFCCETFDESHPLHSTSCTHSHHRNCGPGDIPGCIHNLLKDRGVEFGQLVPALQCVRVVAWLQVVFGGS